MLRNHTGLTESQVWPRPSDSRTAAQSMARRSLARGSMLVQLLQAVLSHRLSLQPTQLALAGTNIRATEAGLPRHRLKSVLCTKRCEKLPLQIYKHQASVSQLVSCTDRDMHNFLQANVVDTGSGTTKQMN